MADSFDGNTGSGSFNCDFADDDPTNTASDISVVSVTVTDDDTGADSETYQYVVVYDPDGGFVTGGGWIDSPAGAYAAD